MELILKKLFSFKIDKVGSQSFFLIILFNTLFISGYFILKSPLAYVLFQNGIPLKQAYSITTTANTLLALSSLYFAFILKESSKNKHSLLTGIFLSTVAIGMLAIGSHWLMKIGIAFYVLGGGLYFFNIVMLVNDQFSLPSDRQTANYLYQIFVNIGALAGSMLFLLGLSNQHAFYYCFLLSFLSFIFLWHFYPKIYSSKNDKINYLKYYSSLFVLFIAICGLLFFANATRLLVIVSFILASLVILYKSWTESNKNLRLFLFLLLLFCIPYWISNAIMFNQFVYFLTTKVTSFYQISPAIIISFDPIMNILFGLGMLNWLQSRNSYRNLLLSNISMLLAFAVLVVGLSVLHGQEKISIIYPLITISLFACSEFLLQTTLNARVKDLLSNNSKHEIFATSMLRSARAFGTVIGYFLISSPMMQNDYSHESSTNFTLYTIMVCLYACTFILFLSIKKLRPEVF